jgi:hypothetical protein
MSSPFAFTRRGLIAAAGLTDATGLLRVGAAGAADGPSRYTLMWSSVDQHPPAPRVVPGRQVRPATDHHGGVTRMKALNGTPRAIA